ncbi:MAG: NDP-sugar synthase [Actinomycetia bacterium]|jgi:mannose-1-phosphate guanylyltransferase|nr:NDP-sugar synthase [Actinomycetes bacterium]
MAVTVGEGRVAVVVEAIVLVGGRGTRLRPLTVTTPKPMLPVAGVPFVVHQLARLRDAGVGHVVLATSYRAEVFEGFLGDGSRLGLELDYVTEEVPLGTGGAMRNVTHLLRGGPDAPVVVMNGDVLSGHDVGAQLGLHAAAGADVTLYLTRVDDARAFGCVPTDAAGRVTAFLEKMPEPVSDQINAGCYVFRRAVLDAIPAGRVVSVERETFPGLLADGAVVLGHVDPAYWLDLGTPAALVVGSRDLVLGRVRSSAVPGPPGERLVLPGAQVAHDATVGGGSTVGDGAVVEAGAVVEGSVLQQDVVVRRGALVRDCVVGQGAEVGEGCVLSGVAVGDGARIGAGCELPPGARVWVDAVLGPHAVRMSSDQS